MVTSTNALGCFARSSWKKGRFLPEKVRRKSALIIQNLHETGLAGARTALGGAACASAALGCRSGRLGGGCGVGLEAAAFPVVAPSRSMTKGVIPNKLPTLSRAESMKSVIGLSSSRSSASCASGIAICMPLIISRTCSSVLPTIGSIVTWGPVGTEEKLF
jgi:hypothetical protein